MKDWLTLRNGIGLVLVIGFFKVGGATPGGYGGFGPALFSMALLVLAACFFSRTLSGVLASPLLRLIDGIYFGSNYSDPPPVNLKLARGYRQQYRFEEAIGECERLLEYHPRSAEIWKELIVAAHAQGDDKVLGSALRKARRRLKREDRVQLEREFPSLAR